MFSSFFRFFGSNTTATNAAVQSAATNSYSQSFTDYALASSHPLLKMAGEIIDAEPSAFFILLGGLVLLGLLFLRWVHRLLSRPSSKHPHLRALKEIFRRVFSWQTSTTLLFSAGIVLASFTSAPSYARHLIRIVLFSFLLHILYQSVRRFVKIYFRYTALHPRGRKASSPKRRNLRLLAFQFFQVVWAVLCSSLFLGLWGVEIGPILAGLGIAGVVAGLALQDAFSHVVGGVSLMLDETYSVGDAVKLDNGIEGIIFEIGFRSTKIRTWDEEIVSIPNGILAKMVITNNSQPVERKRVKIMFQIDAASASADFAKEIITLAVSGSSGVLSKPEPFVTLMEAKGAVLVFRAVFYVETVFVKITTSDEVLRTALALFEKNGIRLIPDESLIRLSR